MSDRRYRCMGGQVRQAVQSRLPRKKRRDSHAAFPEVRQRREQLADTLDYPPRGSPDAFDPEFPEEEAAEPLSTEADSSEKPCEPENPKNK